MNAIQRAWRYITRKPTKSILLIITFFVIGNLVILGLGISQAADNAKVLTRKQMRAVVSYEADYNAYYKYIDSLTDQDEIDRSRSERRDDHGYGTGSFKRTSERSYGQVD